MIAGALARAGGPVGLSLAAASLVVGFAGGVLVAPILNRPAPERAPAIGGTLSPALEAAVAAPPPARLAYALPDIPRLPPTPMPRALAPQPTALPAWRRYAVAFAPAAGAPLIAIVIDDLGLNETMVRRAIALDPAVTLAFLPYASNLDRQVAAARAEGHEILLHMPMEPLAAPNDPGPNALLTGLDDNEILRRLRWALDRVPEAVGLNNHMGSKFTADRADMALVMTEAKARGLMFLDSRTTAETVGFKLARRLDLPRARRDVFLDNEADAESILRQLRETERVARAHGAAVAIGHPHAETLTALAQWLPEARARGLLPAPITAIAARRERTPGLAAAATEAR